MKRALFLIFKKKSYDLTESLTFFTSFLKSFEFFESILLLIVFRLKREMFFVVVLNIIFNIFEWSLKYSHNQKLFSFQNPIEFICNVLQPKRAVATICAKFPVARLCTTARNGWICTTAERCGELKYWTEKSQQKMTKIWRHFLLACAQLGLNQSHSR